MLIPFYFDYIDDRQEEHEVLIEYLYCRDIKSEPEKIYILGIARKISYDSFNVKIQYKDDNNNIFEIQWIYSTYSHPNLYDIEKIPFLQYCMLKQNSVLSYNEKTKTLYCKYDDLNVFSLFRDWKQIT